MLGLINPRPHSRRAEFYHQLGIMIRSGVSLPNALASMHRNGGFGVSRKTVESWMQRLSMGSTFEEAIAASSDEVPALDIALLGSGEKSGRFEDCLSALSHYYSQIAANIRSVLSGLAWPILTLFIMIALGPLPDLVLKGDVSHYFGQVFRPVVILCGLFVLMSLAFDSRRGRPWQAWMERVLGLVPFLGGGIKAMALARFSLALEALLNAGVDTPKAWSSAAYASGSPMLAREMKSFGSAMERGRTPSEWLQEARFFPDLFKMSYATGELSGKVDENLQRLIQVYAEEGSMKLQAFSAWFPRLIYLIIVLVAAYRILSFYSGYFGGLGI